MVSFGRVYGNLWGKHHIVLEPLPDKCFVKIGYITLIIYLAPVVPANYHYVLMEILHTPSSLYVPAYHHPAIIGVVGI